MYAREAHTHTHHTHRNKKKTPEIHKRVVAVKVLVENASFLAESIERKAAVIHP